MQHISLVAFLAWIGLGADGLSSSCYGPEETFIAWELINISAIHAVALPLPYL